MLTRERASANSSIVSIQSDCDSRASAISSEPPVGLAEGPRTYRLTPAKLSAAQRALGARTVTETIEVALDLMLFRHELVRGTVAMLGVEIEPPDTR